MKLVFLILSLLLVNLTHAHGPDLSILMIYQQNGKTLLVIKSALTAFEGEIDYTFGKNSYKNADEFQVLAIKHFQRNCKVAFNGETVRFHNPTVILGHETTLFAELLNVPKDFNSISVRNAMFGDMPSNMCEVILNFNKMPQKQFILNNDNDHAVRFKLNGGKWTLDEATHPMNDMAILSVSMVFIIVFIMLLFRLKKGKFQLKS